MAKLTRSNSLSALGEGDPTFSAGPGRISIGITSKVTGTSYHLLHLSESEAQRLAALIAERIEINALQSLR